MKKHNRLGSGNNIYKFNSDGKLMETYSGASECALKNKISRGMVYKAVNDRYLVRSKFYLSINPLFDIYSVRFMIKKSSIKAEKTIENYKIISDYASNLLITLQKDYHKLQPQQISKIIEELVLTNLYKL